uniref:Uncharacterized protein n=1 Tax=Anguilla anguilla TaxID=7936 RepID=A0A0E9SDW9_ANGAN
MRFYRRLQSIHRTEKMLMNVRLHSMNRISVYYQVFQNQ